MMTYVLGGLVTGGLFRVDHMVSHLALIEIVNLNVLRTGPNITIEINAMLMIVLEVMM